MENFGEFIVNHWILWTLFFGLLALLVGSVISSNLGAMAISTAQAVQIVNQKKGVFVDIRDKAAFEKEHIADSVNMPLSTMTDGSAKLKNKTQPIILVPAMGQQTSPALKYLQEQGVAEVYVLKGGLNTWKEAKLPLFS